MSTAHLNVEQLIGALKEIRQKEVVGAARSAIDQSMTEYVNRTRNDIILQLKAVQQPVPARLLRARYRRTRTTMSRLSSRVDIGTMPFNPIRFPGIKDSGRYQRGRRGRVGQGVRARGGFRLHESFIAKAPNSGMDLVWTRDSTRGAYPIKVERIPIADEVTDAERRIKPEIETILLPQKFHEQLQQRLAKYR